MAIGCCNEEAAAGDAEVATHPTIRPAARGAAAGAVDAALTQGEVATRLKTYASFVSKCESGERRIDVVELAAFCKVYGVDLVAFLEGAGLA